jgi:hypothetical protein
MPKKQSQLTAATSVADADEMNIDQGGYRRAHHVE